MIPLQDKENDWNENFAARVKMRGFPPGFSFSVFAKKGRAACGDKGEKEADGSTGPAERKKQVEARERGGGPRMPNVVAKNGARKERDRERERNPRE